MLYRVSISETCQLTGQVDGTGEGGWVCLVGWHEGRIERVGEGGFQQSGKKAIERVEGTDERDDVLSNVAAAADYPL